MIDDYENSIKGVDIDFNEFDILNNIHVTKILEMNKENNKKDLSKDYISQIYNNIIGNNYIIKSPFGYDNYLIYCDYTASGRGLISMENFIQNKVLTSYANVHSTVGFCAEQTSNLCKESKDILRDYCNAWGNYSIIFHGQGCTGAINKCIDLLNIKHYINFYENLESLANIYNTLFNGSNIDEIELKKKVQFEIMTRDLRKKIDKNFRTFFFQCNFCYKITNFDNNLYKCLLCKDEKGNNLHFNTEGNYHSHEKTTVHINNKKEFYKNPIKNLFKSKNDKREYYNFLEEIRQNYKITEGEVNWTKLFNKYDKDEESKLSYLYNLIKDYKRFKPVIFVTVFEHNSNKLSWMETQAEVVTINDFDELHQKLNSEEYKNRYIKIGSFTAASNITGYLLDIDEYSIEMHKNGGLAFFDYASGAPYLQMNLNEKLPDNYRKKLNFVNKFSNEDYEKYCYKDGIFFSPHKFVGGPNTPGVLIIHNRITMNILKPTQAGGGTVVYVYNGDIDYVLDNEIKEESGTPNILGNIRIGIMTFIRSKIEHDLIIDIDEEYNKLMDNIDEPNIYILGNDILKGKAHIPVFSFIISYGDKFYHPNYICALLNDLFGIQSRPGCSCAPDYGQLLLKKRLEGFETFKKFIIEGNEIFRPGYTRLNLPYFYPKFIIEYIIKAIKFVCRHAQLFIGLYNYDIKSGKFFFYDTKKLPKITQISKMFNFENNENNNEIVKNSSLSENELSDNLSIYTFGNNNNKIKKEQLDNIFTKIENYCNSDLLFEDLKKAEKEILPELRDNEFELYDKFRWFLLYKDLNDEIKKLEEMEKNHKYSVLGSIMNEKRNRLVEFKWSMINNKD